MRPKALPPESRLWHDRALLLAQILDRGERLELLVSKTDNLQSDSLVFRRQSRALRRKMWWQSARMLVFMGGLLALALFLVVTGICGIRLRQCRGQH